jgi:hypothetical protein
MKKHIVLFVAAALVCLPGFASAQRQFELIPSISAGGTYDDNINLTNTNEQSDYITAVTPSLALNVLTQNTRLGMSYAPSFVWYNDFSENNNTRHLGTVSWEQRLTQYLDFTLTNTYLNSEDPLEDTLDVAGIRQTRNKYWVNTASASFGYVFGAENRLEVGYGREDRENDEITLENSAIQTPFGNVTYWFNVKNGIQVNYGYTDAKFTRDDNFPASSDYTSHTAGMRYMRRFSPRSTAYFGYDYSTFDYERLLPQDFDVHNPYVGLEHAFSPEFSFSGNFGWFIRVNEFTENEDGPTFNLSLTRTFSRGNITIGGDGGWYMESLDPGLLQSGFREYYGGFVRGTYQLLESLSIYAGGAYRWEEDRLDITSDFITANCGVSWSFMRWFALSLSYTYAERSDDIEINSYTNNRVMLILSASKPYRF